MSWFEDEGTFPAYSSKGTGPSIMKKSTTVKDRTRTSRTSKPRVTYESPKVHSERHHKRRKSKKKYSPRTGLIKQISRNLKKFSPSRIKNKYLREVAETSLILSPVALIGLYLYLHREKFNPPPSDPSV